MMMRRTIIFAALLAFGFSVPTVAQSCNGQPQSGYICDNPTGGPAEMIGTPNPVVGNSTTPGTLTLYPGSGQPVSPVNGQIWITSDGMYVWINGAPVGPLGTGGGGGGTPANPTGTVGLTAVNGSLTTYMRSDAAPPLSQAIIPTWTGLHTFNAGAAIAGLTVTSAFTATGLVTNADLANPATTVNGQTCTLGSTCSITTGSASITPGTTTVQSGSPPCVLVNSATTVLDCIQTLANSYLTNPATTVNGQVCTLGSTCSITAASTSFTPGTTTIQSATAPCILVNSTGTTSACNGLGTGVYTALNDNIGSAGSVVVNGGALGTPSSGTVTNLTGTASININGTVGANSPNTGAFTTLTASTSLSVANGGAVVASAVASFGGGITLAGSSYLNWGTTYGAAGYGLRDSGGTPQVSSSGGSWNPIAYVQSGFSPTNGYCAQWVNVSGGVALKDAGAACGSGSSSPTFASLSGCSSISIDFTSSINFAYSSFTGSCTLNFPTVTSSQVGQSGYIQITQSGTAGTLAFAPGYQFDTGTHPVIDSVASSVSVLQYYVRDTSHVWVTMPFYGLN